MKAQLIKTNGKILEIVPDNGKTFILKELYRLIETDIIQVLRLPNNRYMIVDEEGKLKKNPILNVRASGIYRLDNIVGNAVICPSVMFR